MFVGHESPGVVVYFSFVVSFQLRTLPNTLPSFTHYTPALSLMYFIVYYNGVEKNVKYTETILAKASHLRFHHFL